MSDTLRTVMIVCDFKLDIVNKGQFDIFTPLFSLNSSETEIQNWIRLDKLYTNVTISSNFSSKKELNHFTTHVINLSTNTVLDVYDGFETFSWNHTERIDQLRFVFELKMQYALPADPPIIWKYCTTEIKSPINTKAISLALDTETAQHTILNNQGIACVVKRYRTNGVRFSYGLSIMPEKPSENWNIFILMLRKEANTELGWYYLQLISQAGWCGKSFSGFEPLIILEINELSTLLKNMSVLDIAAVERIIKPSLTPTVNEPMEALELNESSNIPVNAATAKSLIQASAKQLMDMISQLQNHFHANQLCDVTVHIKNRKITAHKLVLSTGSTIWRDLFDTHQTLNDITIKDFDYDTVKQLIEYMYTGTATRVTDHLLIAADRYGVKGLKELCVIQLINMETIVTVLELADKNKSSVFFEEAEKFIRENYDEFIKRFDFKELVRKYPVLLKSVR